VRLQLDRIRKRMAESKGVELAYDDTVVELIKSRCTEHESGGRMIDAILTNTVLPRISREFLARLGDERPVDRVALGVADGDLTYDFAGA
jgi:type VI secretion system protein VasG